MVSNECRNNIHSPTRTSCEKYNFMAFWLGIEPVTLDCYTSALTD